MVQVELHLTKVQFRKFNKGQAFQLSHKQLTNKEGEHKVTVDVDKKLYNRMQRSMKNGKGIRFPKGLTAVSHSEGAESEIIMEPVTGQGIQKDVKRRAKQTGQELMRQGKLLLPSERQLNSAFDNVVLKIKGKKRRGKKVAQAVELPEVEPDFGLAPDQLMEGGSFKSFFKKVGRAFKPVGKALKPAVPVLKQIGKEVVRTALPMAAEAAAGAAGAYLGGPAGAVVGKELGKTAGSAGAQAINKQIGNGVRKGSQEMKERMARLRAMRKTKGSGLGSIAKSVGKVALKEAAPIIIKEGTKAAIKSMSGEGLYVQKRHKRVIAPLVPAHAWSRKSKVKNPRIRVLNSLLLNGVPQVSGNGYASWGYA